MAFESREAQLVSADAASSHAASAARITITKSGASQIRRLPTPRSAPRSRLSAHLFFNRFAVQVAATPKCS